MSAPSPSEAFRTYEDARDSVREVYRRNHEGQTLAFVKAKKAEYLSLDRATMGIWEALAKLEELVDDSDPDTELSQLEHGFQAAEALRVAGHSRAMILTGLIHDMGKVLCLFGEPQWAVVGDTFPVGCPFSDKIVYPELFAGNRDLQDPALQRAPWGIYEEGCGLDQVHLSWGHDEYLYHVVKDHLPDEALAAIRYHSFYAQHRENAYDGLLDDRDRALFEHVKAFNPFDLYSKGEEPPDIQGLRPYYQELVHEFFPAPLAW